MTNYLKSRRLPTFSPLFHPSLPHNQKRRKNRLFVQREAADIARTAELIDGLLSFRHLHVHGYAFRLEVARLRGLAAPVPGLCREFLSDIERRLG